MKRCTLFLLFIFFTHSSSRHELFGSWLVQNDTLFPLVFAEETASGSSLLEITPQSGSTVPLVQTGSVINRVPVSKPSVCISEVLWAGSDLSTADEWVELAAVGSGSINLHGWTLRSMKDGNEVVLASLDNQFMQAGRYLMIANTAADSSRLLNEPDILTSSMSLPNTKLLLRLRDGSGALMDEVDDGIGIPFAGTNISNGTKASMERIDCALSGTIKEHWITATTSRGFDAGSPMLGSPTFAHGTAEAEPASESPVLIESEIPEEPLHKPIISEIFPDPAGSDDAEWIELFNSANQSIDLSSWVLQSGGKKWTFPTASGSQIGPLQTLFLSTQQTRLTLPNRGGEVTLTGNGEVVDTFVYPQSIEGVSFIRGSGGVVLPHCTPRPGTSASVIPSVGIDGLPAAGTHVTSLNLQAVASGGTLKNAQCRWDFGDGFLSESCNPPSHAMKAEGEVELSLQVVDHCGNTMKHTARVFVLPEGKAPKGRPLPVQCTPSSFSGVLVTEFLPAPGNERMEFIELKNYTNKSLNLCGWSIDDEAGGSKPYALDTISVEGGGYVLIPREQSGIALNNDQDIVRLIAPLKAGGTGVLITHAYQDAPDDSSSALRSDGHWLWTPFISPGGENQFEEVDPTLGISPVILKEALPNPKGDDRYGEWIVLENKTMYPQWLNDWRVESESGGVFKLDGVVLSRKEQRVVSLEDTGFTLKNKSDTVLLKDPANHIRSVLGWEKVQEAQVIEQFVAEDTQVIGEVDGDDPLIDMPTLLGMNIYNYSSVSTLIKSKKLELQIDSINKSHPYVFADGIDVQMLALRSGYAFVTEAYDFSRRLEFQAYERDARVHVRGIWADRETALWVDEQKIAQAQDRKVREEGVALSIDPPSGIVSSGTVLDVRTNVPARIAVRYGTGNTVSGSGINIQDGAYSIVAEYAFKTHSGTVSSIVLLREYSILRDHYAPCIRVSEVYPSPMKGEEEWVELYNKCDQEVNLLGWSIDDMVDSGSKPVTFGTGIVVRAREYLVLSGSALPVILNNGGDTVTIRTPRKTVSDSIVYPPIKKGRAYVLVKDTFCMTDELSPGRENSCIVHKKPKKVLKPKVKTVKQGIGIGTKFASVISGTGTFMNTKIDQKFSQLEGMITNESKKYVNHAAREIPMTVISGTIVIFFLCALYLAKMK